ncbi:MAG TPA: hypothetical protein VF040_21015 [Ktedonobacterales bacterium]
MASTNSLRGPDELSGAFTFEQCAICQRQPAVTAVSCPPLDDDHEDIHVFQRQWPLCTSCAHAVGREAERAALATPLRMVIALAVVASDRRPQVQARPRFWTTRYWEETDMATQNKLVTRAVILFFFWPVIVLVGVLALTFATR